MSQAATPSPATFKFKDYSVAELDACGRAFIGKFSVDPLAADNKVWTDAVLDWFRSTAPADVRVYPPAPGARDEHIVDLCHTTYPLITQPYWPSVAFYERCFACHCEMKLALECEWGRSGNANHSLVMVLDDACKLAVLRARAKVMIYSTFGKNDPNRVLEALERLRGCHRDTDPWPVRGCHRKSSLVTRPTTRRPVRRDRVTECMGTAQSEFSTPCQR